MSGGKKKKRKGKDKEQGSGVVEIENSSASSSVADEVSHLVVKAEYQQNPADKLQMEIDSYLAITRAKAYDETIRERLYDAVMADAREVQLSSSIPESKVKEIKKRFEKAIKTFWSNLFKEYELTHNNIKKITENFDKYIKETMDVNSASFETIRGKYNDVAKALHQLFDPKKIMMLKQKPTDKFDASRMLEVIKKLPEQKSLFQALEEEFNNLSQQVKDFVTEEQNTQFETYSVNLGRIKLLLGEQLLQGDSDKIRRLESLTGKAYSKAEKSARNLNTPKEIFTHYQNLINLNTENNKAHNVLFPIEKIQAAKKRAEIEWATRKREEEATRKREEEATRKREEEAAAEKRAEMLAHIRNSTTEEIRTPAEEMDSADKPRNVGLEVNRQQPKVYEREISKLQEYIKQREGGKEGSKDYLTLFGGTSIGRFFGACSKKGKIEAAGALKSVLEKASSRHVDLDPIDRKHKAALTQGRLGRLVKKLKLSIDYTPNNSAKPK